MTLNFNRPQTFDRLVRFSFQNEKHSVLISHHFQMILMLLLCELDVFPQLFCFVLKSLSTVYESGLTIKQYEFLFTGPAQSRVLSITVDVAIIYFVKVLELLCEHCEHGNLAWLYIHVSISIYGLS